MTDYLPNPDPFLINVGACITNWAHIEEKLFELCAIALKAPRKQAAIVYYRTPMISSRVTLVSELIAAVLPPRKPGAHETPVEEAWRKITKELDRLIPQRNALVHYPAKYVYPEDRPINSPNTTKVFSFRPHRNERLRGRPFAVESLDAKNLPKHAASLTALEMELRKFSSTLRTAMS